jgi:hypothetical protein
MVKFDLAGRPFAISLFSSRKLLCLYLFGETASRQPSCRVPSLADSLKKRPFLNAALSKRAAEKAFSATMEEPKNFTPSKTVWNCERDDHFRQGSHCFFDRTP